MATRRRDNHQAARALADWARTRFGRTEERNIAATYGVSVRTLWNWKAALDDDSQLAALYREAVQKHVTADWSDQLDLALQRTIARLLTLIETETDLAKVTEAFAKLSEVAVAKEMLRGALASEQAAVAASFDGTNHPNAAPIGPN